MDSLIVLLEACSTVRSHSHFLLNGVTTDT